MLFAEALATADKFFKEIDNDMKVIEALDSGEKWLFIGGHQEVLQMGSRKVWIDKTSGVMSEFVLPSEEGFALLKNATEIEL